MAYYALLNEDNIVTYVFPGNDEQDDFDWEAYYESQTGQVCKRTSFNTFGGIHYDQEAGQPSADQSKAFRFNYAGIGHTFLPDHGDHGAFVAPQPFSSWVLSPHTCRWEPPIRYPEDGGTYTWDEINVKWVKLT